MVNFTQVKVSIIVIFSTKKYFKIFLQRFFNTVARIWIYFDHYVSLEKSPKITYSWQLFEKMSIVAMILYGNIGKKTGCATNFCLKVVQTYTARGSINCWNILIFCCFVGKTFLKNRKIFFSRKNEYYTKLYLCEVDYFFWKIGQLWRLKSP